MPSRENPVVANTKKTLEKKFGANIWLRKKHGTAYGIAGDPDLYGCLEGRFFGIEMKRPGEGAKPLQVERLKRIALAGGIAGVAHSPLEAYLILTNGALGETEAQVYFLTQSGEMCVAGKL